MNWSPRHMSRSPEREIPEEEGNFLDYWKVLARRKRFIGLFAGAAFAASVATSLLLPNIYASTASILPPQQDGSSISSVASRIPGGVGGLASGFLGIKSPSELWVGILKSRTVKDAIIARFDLKDLYNAGTMEGAMGTLDKSFSVRKSNEGIIFITVEDKDPEMAAGLANAFVEELDRVNKSMVMTSGKRVRVFVEERLNEAKKELSKGEEAIRAFQEKNRAVKLDVQSEIIIGVIGSVKGQFMAKEVELETLLSYATPNHPQVGILQAQLAGLGERLRELEEGKKENMHQKDIFIPTIKMPDLTLRYARLLRDAKVQQTLYAFLTQQYEMARIQEAKDSPTVQVLDTAKASRSRLRPRRRLIVMGATLIAAFSAVFMVLFMNQIGRSR